MLSRTKLTYNLLHELSQTLNIAQSNARTHIEHPHLSQNSNRCIHFLITHGPQTAGDIAQHLDLTSGSTTTLLTKLEQEGFVRRKADPNDLRKTIIHPVLRKMKQRSDRIQTAEQQLLNELEHYSLEEIAIISDFLKKVTIVYQKRN